jgi:hypothetical protein
MPQISRALHISFVFGDVVPGCSQKTDNYSHIPFNMVNGRVKFHIAPTGRRKHPPSGPRFDNVAKLRVELISKAKQKAIDELFAERTKVEYASEYGMFQFIEGHLIQHKDCLQVASVLSGWTMPQDEMI